MPQPPIILAQFIGATIRRDQQFGPGFRQTFADIGQPHVLADRDTNAHTLDRDRSGERTRLEHPFLVKNPVIGQFVLQRQRRDLPAIEQRHGVVELAVLAVAAADQHRRPAIGGDRCHPFKFSIGRLLQRRFQHQILGRIADQLQLGINDKVRSRMRGTNRQHRVGIAAQVPH